VINDQAEWNNLKLNTFPVFVFGLTHSCLGASVESGCEIWGDGEIS
jgi:hypothetical protein